MIVGGISLANDGNRADGKYHLRIFDDTFVGDCVPFYTLEISRDIKETLLKA